ncbi:MAG TPA: WhiB family transcriptional regulator [Streptosporangiaceae bacterium]|nr:WhiB family transcriptional regulator [Streptosporangiaceae bacterium]
MSRGACRREDPELFFPVTETYASAGRQIPAAKAVCGCCLVRVTCLACALTTGQDGVWGGTTGSERRRAPHGPARPPGTGSARPASGSVALTPAGSRREPVRRPQAGPRWCAPGHVPASCIARAGLQARYRASRHLRWPGVTE